MISKGFKPDKKYLKRILELLGAIIVFLIIVHMLNYIYFRDFENNERERIIWHSFYEDKGKIDNVYIGSSHVYNGVNPMLLDNLNGQYNFDLSSGSQRLSSSYYLLKETDRINSPSHVYLELYYLCNTKDNFDDDSDPADAVSNNWRNIDCMQWSLNKLEFMFFASEPDQYLDTFLPFTRYREKLDDWNYISQTMAEKREEPYLTYQYNKKDIGEGYIEYLGQGYFYSTNVFLDNNRLFKQSRILEENPLGATSENYLCKIISYCQKRNIDITLFVAPMDELPLVSTEHYDNFISQISEIAEEYEIAFYDFNLAKDEYLPLQCGEHFRDANHLNGIGADIYTAFFNKVVSGSASDNETYFFDSYTEKLQNMPPSIYGLYYRDSAVTEDTEESFRTVWIASNRDQGMEYKVIMAPEEGEEYLIQDFTENKRFVIPSSEHGICTIAARMDKEEDEVQTMEIAY